MTPNDLIAAFETLADAPDGVKRLRELVLQLAIRGKLIPQHAGDQPSTAALEHIHQTKARNGKKAAKVAEPTPAPPFPVPEGWEWIRVAEAGSIQLGRQRSPDNHHGPHMVPYLRVANVQEARLDLSDVKLMNFSPEEQEKFRLASGDVLLNEGQSYELVGRPAVYRGEIPGCCFQNTLIRFRVYEAVIPEYALTVFRAYMRSGEFRAEAQQTTNIAHLSAGRLAQVAFPLPPLAEQHRIVARVDELMGLLDRLEAARTARDDVRRAARDAALAALRDAEDTDAVEAAWGRIAGQMDALFAEPEDVGPLRQAVLGLAVRGRLVPQDRTDTPAHAFLQRIAAEKDSGPIREGVPLDAQPFSAPSGWSWARLVDLVLAITDGDHLPPPQVPEGVPFLTIGNVSKGALEFGETRHVPETYFRKLGPMRVPVQGDLIYTVVGATYGRPVKVDTSQAFCVQRHIAILKSAKAGFRDYLFWFLRSALAYDQATASITGSAQPTVALRPLRSFAVPVPPLAEQHRIVAKVDALMAICDALEARLTAARDLHAQFAAAAVHHLDV